jgi:hypothetical protein
LGAKHSDQPEAALSLPRRIRESVHLRKERRRNQIPQELRQVLRDTRQTLGDTEVLIQLRAELTQRIRVILQRLVSLSYKDCRAS